MKGICGAESRKEGRKKKDIDSRKKRKERGKKNKNH